MLIAPLGNHSDSPEQLNKLMPIISVTEKETPITRPDTTFSRSKKRTSGNINDKVKV